MSFQESTFILNKISPGVQQLLEENSLDFQEANSSQVKPLTSKQLLQQAQAIAQEIKKRTVRSLNGHINWIALQVVDPKNKMLNLQPLNFNLYDGKCGITLFLAALDNLMGGNTQFGNLAWETLQSVSRFFQERNSESRQKFIEQFGIGGATGLSSVIYTLVKTSQLLHKPALLEDAYIIAQMLTPQLITNDQFFDVLSGGAGAILALLALYSETRESVVLDKAVICGQHLLAHQCSINGAPKAWTTLDTEKPLTGFSHGASGITYTLLRLYEVTQNKDYLKAAEEGIAYERSVFSEVEANWPDFRFSRQKKQVNFPVAWCHGASGIGLARLGALSIYQTDQILQDIEVALQTTQQYGMGDVDDLCCGNFSRIELLLVAAQNLQRPNLLHLAQQQCARIVTRAEQTGGYTLISPNLPKPIFHPGFFLGTAGIGYELLRLAYPGKLPSVLLWE